MPLHPRAKALIKRMMMAGFRWSPDATPRSMRDSMNRGIVDGARIQPVHEVTDQVVPGASGKIPVRVYRPSADTLPVLVWLHGGGWVTGSIETHDLLCRQLSVAVDAIVVSVDYRLAPETKFPGAVDDCVTTWKWVGERAVELGGDPSRIALGGDSAGGNLAAVLALVAREQCLPAPTLQLLVYPVTDHEFESPSMIENAKNYVLETEQMRWFFDHYAATPGDFDDWRMSPMRAEDLTGLPDAVVITAECDPLRDQGEAYGRRLRAAGVQTEIVRADGLFHGFFGMQKFVPTAQEPWDIAVNALRRSFGKV